ncbi:NAD(P)-dependent oxidoreductase [Neiella marina]|uniref:NAD(P)-dependent oxidoreductase n=1 Tax=Neiella holothuriorum TaxID=2870530 RepID=A0ABS7EER3_9GAMM|nr:NAD(P)-dependent oxidoreductase [Neiella holothuriorum]MBW8190827.1 NAD(P)-dependent oxidoreductase [Neiella holothuriorum]
MKIAVTGATGFIGIHVVKLLLAQGHQVTAILHRSPLPLGDSQLKTVSLPLTQLASSPLAFARLHEPDVLIDLGWQHLDDYHHQSHIEQQPQAHLAMISNLLKQGLKRVVGIGTCFEYGEAQGEIDEQQPCQPSLGYAQGKLNLLQMLQQLQAQCEFSLLWMRPFYVYGLNPNRATLFSAIAHAAQQKQASFELQTPYAEHDFIAVEQLAAHIVHLATEHQATGVVNCCSGKVRSVMAIAQHFANTNQLNVAIIAAADAEPAPCTAMFGSVARLHAMAETS